MSSPGEVIGTNCKICSARCKLERNVEAVKCKYADVSSFGLDKTHDNSIVPIQIQNGIKKLDSTKNLNALKAKHYLD